MPKIQCILSYFVGNYERNHSKAFPVMRPGTCILKMLVAFFWISPPKILVIWYY